MSKKKNNKKVQNNSAGFTPNGNSFNNGLSDIVVRSGNPYGANQITQTDTLFKNLRYYFISNNRQLLSQCYSEIGLFQTIVDVPVDDALRGGIKIKTDQLSPEQISDLETDIEQNNDIANFGEALKWNRLYGGAAIIIMTDQNPQQPLNVDAIKEDSNLEFRAVDMWELFGNKQYTGDNYIPNLMTKSEYYTYYSMKIHKSRVIIMRGKEAPSFVRPRMRGWGLSICEPIVTAMNQYLKTNDLTFEVLDEFKLDIFKIKGFTNALITKNGTQTILERIQLANMQKNYQNALCMDSEDDYAQKQLSFSGISEVMNGIRMQLASDLRMPLSKVFGISSSGFSSGEDDIENYNAMVSSSIRSKYKFDIIKIVKLRAQQKYDLVPEDLTIEYEPLRVLSSEQEENVKTQKFNRLLQARSAGEITINEFRVGCNKDDLLPNQLEEEEELKLEKEKEKTKKDETKMAIPTAIKKSTTIAPEAKT